MPHMDMQHVSDPKQEILDKLGDLTGLQVFHNDVVVATYLRPNTTKGGIILTDNYRDEDRIQGKVGLVIGVGSNAFEPDGTWWSEGAPKIGSWVWYRPSDGFALTLNGKEGHCRVLKDTSIRGTVEHPDMVW